MLIRLLSGPCFKQAKEFDMVWAFRCTSFANHSSCSIQVPYLKIYFQFLISLWCTITNYVRIIHHEIVKLSKCWISLSYFKLRRKNQQKWLEKLMVFGLGMDTRNVATLVFVACLWSFTNHNLHLTASTATPLIEAISI